jgi:hypothetical protein
MLAVNAHAFQDVPPERLDAMLIPLPAAVSGIALLTSMPEADAGKQLAAR